MTDATIAYVLKGFPRLSETFIANEVRLLSRMGMRLRLFSIKQGDDLADADGLPDVHYLPQVTSLSATTLVKWLAANAGQFIACQAYLLRTCPGRYFQTLAFTIRCAAKYRTRPLPAVKKTFIKEFLFASHIAENILRAGHFRHIHAHFCHDATNVAWMTSLLTDIPFSFTAHAKDIYRDGLNPGDLLERKLTASRFAVTCTRNNVEFLRNRTSEPEKVRCIYHGLNTRMFQPHDGQTNGRVPKLLTVGRHVEKKGFSYLVEACRILRDRGIDFELDIIGERGDQTDAIVAAIDNYDLGDRIRILPPVPQSALTDFYQSAMAFVLPCIVLDDGDRDGIPNVMAEAMASGLPVIVTGVSGIPELVDHGVNGIIVPPRDSETLADEIQGILANDELRRNLAASARTRVEQVFDAEQTHVTLKHLFETELGNAY